RRRFTNAWGRIPRRCFSRSSQRREQRKGKEHVHNSVLCVLCAFAVNIVEYTVTNAMTVDIHDLAVPGVRTLEPYQPGKPLSELEREYGVRDAVKLASNESPLGPSPWALAAAAAALKECTRYPDGGGFELKHALAANLGVAAGQITLGNGSNDVLELAVRAFVAPQNEVIYSQHAFAVYALATAAVGAKAVVTPARAWGHDLAAMRAAVTARTRLVFIANPNNPTGTWVTAAALDEFIRVLPPHVL